MNAHSFIRRLGAVLLGAVLLLGGLIKLMDPLGSQLVMEAYLRFLHLSFLGFAAGFLSLLFNLLECVLGAALIAGLFPLVAGAASGVLMLFYTLLTLALLIANPSMDCGCFGELVHLTHAQSFIKNLVLMGLWALAFFPARRQLPQRKHRYIAFGLVMLGCLGFMVHSLRSLPAIDLTDLRIGTELSEGRIPLLSDDGEYHDEMLLEGKVLLISVYDPAELSEKEMDRIYEERSVARAAGIRPVVVYAGEGGIYSSDKKTLMSLNRSNGGASLLVDGQIVRKWTNSSLPDADQLEELFVQDPSELVAESELHGRVLMALLAVIGVVVLLI